MSEASNSGLNLGIDVRCPKCRSTDTIMGQEQESGLFRVACAKCHWFQPNNYATQEESVRAFGEGTASPENTTKGDVIAKGIFGVEPSHPKETTFLDPEQQKRWDSGAMMVHTYSCDVCKGTATGKIGKGGFHEMPRGWMLQHPTANMVCSANCKDELIRGQNEEAAKEAEKKAVASA